METKALKSFNLLPKNRLIKKAKKGNKIYIESVKVMKPGGIIAEIGSVNLKIQ